MTLAEGGTAAVTGLLEAEDDGPTTAIEYTLTADVGNGELMLSGATLSAGDTFTQADIDAGNIEYVHDGSNNLSDSFGFTVNDGVVGNAVDSGTFLITVTNVNDDPVAEYEVFYIQENNSLGAAVDTVTASDPDDPNPGDTITFTLETVIGGSSTDFAIDGATGAITAETVLDYESQDSYTLQVRVTDSQGAFTDTWVVINVTNDAADDASYVLGTPIPDQSFSAADTFVFVIPADTFADTAPVTYDFNGTLPGWLNFNASTETFFYIGGSGTAGDAATIEITATFYDSNMNPIPGGTTTDTFDVDLIASLDADAIDPSMADALYYLEQEGDDAAVVEEGAGLEVQEMMVAMSVPETESEAAQMDTELADLIALLDNPELTVTDRGGENLA